MEESAGHSECGASGDEERQADPLLDKAIRKQKQAAFILLTGSGKEPIL